MLKTVFVFSFSDMAIVHLSFHCESYNKLIPVFIHTYANWNRNRSWRCLVESRWYFLDLFSCPGLLLLLLTLLTFLTNIFNPGPFHCTDFFVCLLNSITFSLFQPMRIDCFYFPIYAKSVYNRFNLCHVWNSDLASEKIRHFFLNDVIHPSFLIEAGSIMSWVFVIAGVFSNTLTHMFFGFTHAWTRLWAITGLFPYLQVFFISFSVIKVQHFLSNEFNAIK